MAGKNKSFNLNDKKIAQKIETMNLELSDELNIPKADIGYRKNNKQKRKGK